MQLRTRGVKEVTIMWDGEVRATTDAIAAGVILKGIGLKVRIAMLPRDKDPNEVPASVVRQAFYQAKPLTGSSGMLMAMQRINGG